MTFDLARLGWDVAKVLGGAVIAGVGAYVMLSRELSYIKGQLAQLIQMVKLTEKNRERVVALEKRAEKMESDLHHAHTKIRSIQGGKS